MNGDLKKDIQAEKVPRTVKYIGTDYSYKHEVVWPNVIGFVILHFFGLWGFIMPLIGRAQFTTFLWGWFMLYVASEGVTIGAHRYYTHRSFKATPLLRAMMVAAQTMSGQNCVFTWCRDHRLHHRYSDTDGDPHNSKRGFFFCHMGWLMHKKHPYVVELGKKIDMSDLEADWMVMFQKKYFYILYVFLAILFPVWVPVHLFGEVWWKSLLTSYFARYLFELHGTWCVNSVAHLYGSRPYDRNIQPVESAFVSWLSLGEGWHNYHHAFPWDYKAAEITMHYNATASIIRFFEKIGLAYDLKYASEDMLENRIKRAGDGSHYRLGNDKARVMVTKWGPLHPLNPTYNTTLPPPDVVLKPEGLPLYHENDVLK